MSLYYLHVLTYFKQDQVRALQADKAKLETVVSKLKIKQKAVAPASETEQVESGSTQLILQLSTQVAELDEVSGYIFYILQCIGADMLSRNWRRPGPQSNL